LKSSFLACKRRADGQSVILTVSLQSVESYNRQRYLPALLLNQYEAEARILEMDDEDDGKDLKKKIKEMKNKLTRFEKNFIFNTSFQV
jgi:hypothetical protein